MALFKIEGVSLAGVSAAVPKNSESNCDIQTLTEVEKKLLIKTTGIEKRRVAANGLCTSDLCFASAEKLLKELNWNRADVGILIFVSQSPDYLLPATAIILQNRLLLSHHCMAFDIGLGCSGYVYGLSVMSSLMSATGIKKGLLLAGDISTDSVSPLDKSTFPLFGDAGTATALEAEKGSEWFFNLQSDGSGFESIIIRHGGLRHPHTSQSCERKTIEPGITRSPRDLELNGMLVFDFAMREVAPNVKALLQFAGKEMDAVDFFIFHQANRLMNETIRKKLAIPESKVPYSLTNFGNTSSASIPLTLVTTKSIDKEKAGQCWVFSGFGVGLSWGSVWLPVRHLVIPDLIEI